jgi:hypothetical protein
VPNEPLPSAVAQAARGRVRGIVDRERRAAGIAADPVVSHEIYGKVAADVAAMQNGWLVRDVEFSSQRRRVGGAIVRAKRLLLRGLHPFPQRQSEYNLAVNRIISHLLDINYRQAIAIERLEDRLEELAEAHEQQRP